MITDLVVEAAWRRWVHYFREYGLNRGHECMPWQEWKDLYQRGIIQ